MKTIFLIIILTLTATFSFAKGAKDKNYGKDDTVKIIVKDPESDPGQEKIQVITEHLEEAIEEIEEIDRKEKGKSIIISSSEGIKVMNDKVIDEQKKSLIDVNFLLMDIGLNGFVDNTDYSIAEAQDFVRVRPEIRNGELFNISTWGSRNFNLWPTMVSLNAVQTRNQKVILSTGIGFQFFSFKYTNPITLAGELDPHFYEDAGRNFRKNKLGITYMSIPLMLTGQTRATKELWITYGVGVIGGYRIGSWTNQKSADDGKVKIRDPFNLEPFQVSLTGEFGVKGILRFYATYQLTNMWKSGLTQQPFAIGIRLFGV